jgi:hypothetical protein
MLARRIRAALLLTAAATPLWAQRSRQPSEFARRSSGSFTFTQSRPLGDLARNIGFGYGGSAAYLFRLDHSGWLSLRADAAFVDYGHETKRVPLSSTIGGRIQVKVVTRNHIVPVSFGPQLTRPSGHFRPYVRGGIGGQFFFTDSHVEGTDDNLDFARTQNQSDGTPSWVAGGGFYVPVTNRRRVNVLLDFGVQYFGGGHAQYLRPGSIEDLDNSQIHITPLESDTRMALVHVGVKVGL